MKFELSNDHSVTLRTVMFKLTEQVSVSGFTATHVRIVFRDDAISEFVVQGTFPNGDNTFRHMPLHDVFGTEWQSFIDNVPAKETAATPAAAAHTWQTCSHRDDFRSEAQHDRECPAAPENAGEFDDPSDRVWGDPGDWH